MSRCQLDKNDATEEDEWIRKIVCSDEWDPRIYARDLLFTFKDPPKIRAFFLPPIQKFITTVFLCFFNALFCICISLLF